MAVHIATEGPIALVALAADGDACRRCAEDCSREAGNRQFLANLAPRGDAATV